jgi:hypothetical protein
MSILFFWDAILCYWISSSHCCKGTAGTTKNSPFKEQVSVLMYENLFFLKKIEVPNIIKHLQPGVTTVSQHWKCGVGK